MAKYELKTVNGYDFYESASVLQKAIRRSDARVAGFFALELWHSGYSDYVWKRLLTISAEDCYGLITREIMALKQSYDFINKGNKKDPKGRVFISKAVILLSDVRKSRDADHLSNLVYDRKDVVDIDKWIQEVRAELQMIPDYTYDCHTLKGKMMGKTKEQFFKDEFNALQPRERGLFDEYFLEEENSK